MIDPELLVKYLNERKAALDVFINGHRERIKESTVIDSDQIRIHLECIGKLEARKSECDTLVTMIRANGFKQK